MVYMAPVDRSRPLDSGENAVPGSGDIASHIQINALAQGTIPQEDMERKRRMREAWEAYRGEFQKPLKVAANQPDDNVLSNRCAPIVDKGVSFLFGKTLGIEAVEETVEPETEIQEFVEKLWGDDDDRMTILSKLAINGAVCGQAFLRLIPASGPMDAPRLVVMDPMLVRMVTPPDDYELILAFLIEYPTVADWQRRQVISRVDPDGFAALAGDADLDDTWTISNYLRKGQAGSWFAVGEPETWPWPFPPIFTCQNLPNPNEPWGIPDLTPDLINQNKVLNFIQSNTSRILKFHAHPKTYATGLTASQINIGVDDLICLPSPDAKLANLEMQSDLASSLNFANGIRSDMDEQSRVPAVALGRLQELPRGNISGVALQLLFQPLLEKTTQKQRLYGKLIREVTRAALVVAGKIPLERFDDYPIELRWQDLLPVDNLAAAQTALVLKQLGVSDSTILAQLGYDPDDELEKSQAEDARKLINFSRGQGLPPSPESASSESAARSPQDGSGQPGAMMQEEDEA
jgi:hypothetical protein